MTPSPIPAHKPQPTAQVGLDQIAGIRPASRVARLTGAGRSVCSLAAQPGLRVLVAAGIASVAALILNAATKPHVIILREDSSHFTMPMPLDPLDRAMERVPWMLWRAPGLQMWCPGSNGPCTPVRYVHPDGTIVEYL